MGEQNPTETPAHPTEPKSEPQAQAHGSSIDETTIAEPTPTPTELTTNGSSSIPSKIPFRPRKIRKLSPDPNSSSLHQIESPKPKKPAKVLSKRDISLPRVPGRPLRCDGEVEAAIRHLRAVDPVLTPLIDHHQPPTFDTFHTPFLALTRSILYQQLAYKAGTSIYTRFVALCGGESSVTPESVLALTPASLRQIGVSGRKASYLHDLSRKYQNGILSDSAIVNMDDKSLFTMLTMVSGIGSWSVHMFMIFSLHRPDVLPVNDLGVRKGVQLLYKLEELPRPSQMEVLCDKWRPYRSVAAWYLWRFVESKGATSTAAAVAVAPQQALLQHQMHQQQEEEEEQPQHNQQQQLMDSLSSLINIGACTWGP